MDLLAGPAYAPLWIAARRRLESNGMSLQGTPLALRLTDGEVDAVAGLLGVRRPSPGAPMRVRLTAVDQALRRSSVGRGLLEVLTALGGPLVDRRAEQAMISADRAESWMLLETHRATEINERLAAWLEHVRTTGYDRRLAGAGGAAAVRTALDVLAVVSADPSGPSQTPEETADVGHRLAVLAAEVVGDAHALDRGRPAGTLVVHALTWMRGVSFPQDAADWRRAWAEAGVACDDLSCDVLVLNLPGFAREPLRLTLRQVTSWRPPAGGHDAVLACENPAVVAAVTDRYGAAAPPVVCVDGVPSTAALLVIDKLSAQGRPVRYHGDFDWRGLMIAGVIARKLTLVEPWRYRSVDYERAIAAGLGTLELAGRPSVSPWDDALAPAMAAVGRAVYEEQVLADLLDDIEHGG